MTTVLVTHDQREALTMSDRIAVLRGGMMAQVDSSEALYNQPTSEFVAAFMGESSFLDVDVRNGEGYFHDNRLRAELATKTGPSNQRLIVRPEKLEFISDSDDRSQFNCFTGKLENFLFQGESFLGLVRLPSGELISMRRNIRQSNQSSLHSVGDNVTIGLHHTDSRIVPGENADG